ncbi:MAG: type II secretion system protein [Candidatus Saccharimonas sp.]
MRSRGFTIIELIVVITIIAILLTLSTIQLSKNQANARDTKRGADISTIARGLEIRYKEGNPMITSPSYVAPGSYPGVNEMLHATGQSNATFTPTQISDGYVSDDFPGTTPQNFTPPNADSTFQGFNVSCASSCGAALPDSSMDSLVTPDTYYYQPVDASGNVCMQGNCVRFELFWRSEVDDTLYKIGSQHQ